MRHNPSFVKAFAESLPPSYRSAFDWSTVSEHAAIAQRRSPGRPGVGTCFAPRLPGHALCIVADDRPGLLATISAALVSERLDVISAEAYTRRLADQSREAVDIFWVRRLNVSEPERPLPKDLIEHLEHNLGQLLDEHFDPRSARIPTQPPPAPTESSETHVRFIENRNGRLSTIEIESSDRTGLLLVLARVLYEQKVQIVSSTIRTEKGRIKDRFEITELDDAPIDPDRRLLVQVAVLDAVQKTFGR